MEEKETGNKNGGGKKKTIFGAKFNAAKSKQFLRRHGATIYMGIAFCMVAAIAVSVFTINMNYTGDIDNFQVPGISSPSQAGHKATVPQLPRQTAAAPVDASPSGVDAVINNPTEPAVNTAKYHMPADGKIIKEYSADALVFSATMNDYRTHSGIDIAADIGSAVYAYSDGVISAIEEAPMMGMSITVQHEFGLTSHYMNVSKSLPIGIEVGKAVKAGDVIAAVGNTAIAEIGDEAHLHFELKVSGDNIDPQKELQ